MAVAGAVAAEAVADVVAAVINANSYSVNRLTLQFHITGKCNLRCKHCYRTEGDVEPLSYGNIISILNQYKALLIEYNSRLGVKLRGHINITGGEPFIRSDIKDILRYIGENKQYYSYGVLSNGSFIDDDMIQVLKETGNSFVQLSIDGDRATHDSLRAKGDYDRVFSTARYLSKKGIKTHISFTANRDNYKHLPSVARECRKSGVYKLWSDRLVPIGTGEGLSDLSITKEIMPHYIDTLKSARGNIITKALYPHTQVAMNRALQFIGSEGNTYSCSAGISLLTVDEFGNVMPCRRMPIICGNVLNDTMKDIYFNNDTFRALRGASIPTECNGCKYSDTCRGGAKCQSYAIYGDFSHPDPSCFIIK